MEQIAYDDELSFLHVHAGNNFGVKPAVGLVPVLFRPNPLPVFRIVNDYELGTVLEMPQTSDFLAARSREDTDPVAEDDVLLLPFLAFALKREVLNDVSFDLAVVLLDEVVRFKLVFD